MRTLGAAAALLLALPAAALADETITAIPFDRYDPAEVTIDAGERVTFANRDVSTHDVVGPGFRSPETAPGRSAPVEGAERLSSGRYEFTCSLHPYMKATLVVRGPGDPPPSGDPPPESPPAPADTTAPGLRVRLAREGRFVLVRIRVTEAARLEVTAGRVTRRRGTEGPKTLTMGFRANPARRFRARVKAVDAGGNETSVTRRLAARR